MYGGRFTPQGSHKLGFAHASTSAERKANKCAVMAVSTPIHYDQCSHGRRHADPDCVKEVTEASQLRCKFWNPQIICR